MTHPSSSPDDRNRTANAAYRRFLAGGDAAGIADLFDLASADLLRTARHLVGDDATAHDLVQVTFLALLQQRTFDAQRDVLPWLAGTLRNQAALVHRRRARALDPTRLGEPGVAIDPAEAAALRELQAEVEAALQQLSPVYQPVVRLHLLHGLDGAAIAASLQRPAGSVRTQLMRGLEKLRALLPVGIAGLVAGLLPSTGVAAVRVAVLGAAQQLAPTAGIAPKATLLRPRTWLAAAAGIAVAALAMLALRRGELPQPGSTHAVAPAPSAATSAPAVLADPAVDGAAERETVATAAAGDFELRGVVRGTVRGVDGQPVADAEVLLWASHNRPAMRGATFEPAADATARTDTDGTFALRSRGAVCYLIARAPGMLSTPGVRGELDGRTLVVGLEFDLVPTAELRGRLVDADGRGVPRFAFGTHRGGGSSEQDRLAVVGFERCELPHLDVTTEADGAFSAVGATGYSYLWEVMHPDHPMLRQRQRVEDGPIVLQLESGVAVRGVVSDAAGAPAVAAEVVLADYPQKRGVCDATGGFVLAGCSMRDGLWLRVEHPGAAIFCAPVAQSALPLQLRLEPAKVLAGRVVDAAGNGVAGVELHLVGDRLIETGARYTEPSTWEHAWGANRATTDGDGAFRFERLYDGVFAIEVREPGAGDFVELLRTRSGVDQLTLRLTAAAARRATIVGSLRDANTGAPIPEAKVTLMRPGSEPGEWNGTSQRVAVVDGNYALGAVATGMLRLTFVAPGFAKTEIAEREYPAGRTVVDVPMHASRSVEVEVHGGEGSQPEVRAHLGDRRWLSLPIAGGISSSSISVHDTRVRLDGLPARAVTIVVERRGGEPIEQVVDLATPRTEPVVFELDSAPKLPEMTFGVLLLMRTEVAEDDRIVHPSDRSWWLEQARDPARLRLPVAVAVTVESTKGKLLARASLGPSSTREVDGGMVMSYPYSVHYPDGSSESSDDAGMPALGLRIARQPIVLRITADGMLPIERRLEPEQLDGEGAFAVFLRPK